MRIADLLLEQSLQDLAAEGFNTREKLYHGSMWEFDSFNGKSLTSRYLYMTPDPAKASAYGRVLYTCYGRPGKQADLTRNSKLVGELVEEFLSEFVPDAERNDKVKKIADGLARKHQRKNGTDYYESLVAVEKLPDFRAIVMATARKLAFESFANGTLYRDGTFSDRVHASLHARGYDSVRCWEVAGRRKMVVVVFKNPADVVIVAKKID